jgi:hypothetical protein
MSGRIRPEGDPHVSSLGAAAEFFDVRDGGVVVRCHGNFNRYRVL